MKIEKISENQIRCTLTHSDLADRELKISELAYGSDKAKSLFQDMMEQASYELGFEADDIPLMIEAVPISSECIVLTITKVEDPEELDTRFSRFAPSVHDNTGDKDEDDLDLVSEEVMNLFQKVQKSDQDFISDITKQESLPDKRKSKITSKKPGPQKIDACIFLFSSIGQVIDFAHAVSNFTMCPNTLYKDKTKNNYHLVIFNRNISAGEFNQLSNAATEFGQHMKNLSYSEAYYKEHFETIVSDHALQSLVQV